MGYSVVIDRAGAVLVASITARALMSNPDAHGATRARKYRVDDPRPVTPRSQQAVCARRVPPATLTTLMVAGTRAHIRVSTASSEPPAPPRTAKVTTDPTLGRYVDGVMVTATRAAATPACGVSPVPDGGGAGGGGNTHPAFQMACPSAPQFSPG